MSSSSRHPLSTRPPLHASDFYVLRVDEAYGIAVLERTSKPFPSTLTVHAENDRLITRLGQCGVAGIVVDMRAAPPNNDPAFERAMAKLRSSMGRIYRRVVVLVTTASGSMQATRLHRADGVTYTVTRDVAHAWAYASTGEGSEH